VLLTDPGTVATRAGEKGWLIVRRSVRAVEAGLRATGGLVVTDVSGLWYDAGIIAARANATTAKCHISSPDSGYDAH
jgi:hypothetical protein